MRLFVLASYVFSFCRVSRILFFEIFKTYEFRNVEVYLGKCFDIFVFGYAYMIDWKTTKL